METPAHAATATPTYKTSAARPRPKPATGLVHLSGLSVAAPAPHLCARQSQQGDTIRRAVLRDVLVAEDVSPLCASSNPYRRDLEEAVTATRLAARLCTLVQQELTAGERQDKSDDSPVTVADYGAQALVAWALQKAFPDGTFSMVAEEDSTDLRGDDGALLRQRITALVNRVVQESGHPARETLSEAQVLQLIDAGASQGGSVGRHWVLDPIDGTRGFVGKRQYAVCLGLIEDGAVVLGVLGCPNLPHAPLTQADGGPEAASRAGQDNVGCLFAAARGQGSFWGPLEGAGLPEHRCRVSDLQTTEGALYMQSFESRHSSHSMASTVAHALGFHPESLKLDSQAKYGALARGDAQAWMRFPPATYREKIWDHAAGTIVVQEAGGVVSDGLGHPLDFSKGRFLDQKLGIIAAPPAIHARLVRAVREAAAN